MGLDIDTDNRVIQERALRLHSTPPGLHHGDIHSFSVHGNREYASGEILLSLVHHDSNGREVLTGGAVARVVVRDYKYNPERDMTSGHYQVVSVMESAGEASRSGNVYASQVITGRGAPRLGRKR